MKMMK